MDVDNLMMLSILFGLSSHKLVQAWIDLQEEQPCSTVQMCICPTKRYVPKSLYPDEDPDVGSHSITAVFRVHNIE